MNIINAIINLVKYKVTELNQYNNLANRVNSRGDALEEYIKNLFAGTFDKDCEERIKKLNDVFSYLGNNSNPPDAMLRGGDAIEVKKIERDNSALALNSSYPKQKIFSNSSMISKKCREAEEWSEKDIIYAVGVVDSKSNKLKHLCFVYGIDYCASDETYSKIKKTIKKGIESIKDVEFVESKELGHINSVDPLGITYMRIRGMWGIANPWKVFDYVYTRNLEKDFNFMCIINKEKYEQFDNTNELEELAQSEENLEILDIKIKDPDRINEEKKAKLIKFTL